MLSALHKQPERRYASVEQFSADIHRHLVGLPVTARKITAAYRAGKFIRRHPIETALAALVLASNLGFTLFTLGLKNEAVGAQERSDSGAGPSGGSLRLPGRPVQGAEPGSGQGRGDHRPSAPGPRPGPDRVLSRQPAPALRPAGQDHGRLLLQPRPLWRCAATAGKRGARPARPHRRPSRCAARGDDQRSGGGVLGSGRHLGRRVAPPRGARDESKGVRRGFAGAASKTFHNLATLETARGAFQDAEVRYRRALAIALEQPTPDPEVDRQMPFPARHHAARKRRLCGGRGVAEPGARHAARRSMARSTPASPPCSTISGSRCRLKPRPRRAKTPLRKALQDPARAARRAPPCGRHDRDQPGVASCHPRESSRKPNAWHSRPSQPCTMSRPGPLAHRPR